MFKHYLLLRYNLYLYGDNPYSVPNPDQWMENRLPMYQRLISSLEKQSIKNFTLLISLCEDTPQRYIDQIKQVTTVPYEICYIQPHEYIKNYKEKEADWLITSRIDNDDEYLSDFIEDIQDNFRQETEILDVKGWQKQGQQYYTSGRNTPNSPFITLVEPWGYPETAMHRPHSLMNSVYPARFIGDKPYYIQHIHGNNVANKIIGKPIKLKTVVGIATFDKRPVERVIDSLAYQCDEIIVYDNEVNPDLTDNGKFFGLTKLYEPCYYLTCDDDLLYPKDYVKNLTDKIDKHGSIVTYHGRKLKGLDVSYYRGHKNYRCLDSVRMDERIDVCGTGVTGFRTDYFNPVGLHNAEDKRMSDLVFSLEAAKNQKIITILEHKSGWIKHLPIDMSRTIAAQDSRNETRQIELANEIWKLNYQSQQTI